MTLGPLTVALTLASCVVPWAYLAAAPAAVVLVGAGDIAWCDGDGDEATARLLDAISGVVFTTGDHAYPNGTDAEFAQCFHPTWGRHKARIRPSLGNHDYHTERAAPYFRYFGEAAGEAGRGYYTYALAGWRIVVLNSNCELIGGCGESDPQVTWLQRVLAQSAARCTLAYWHHPRFSSGTEHGSEQETGPLWEALYDHGAEIVVSGHEHNYERFAPQNPAGAADPERGIREFVVGTGGADHYPFGAPIANSEVRNGDTWGVLRLTLAPDTYRWEFIPVSGRTFSDSGSGRCH